MVVGLHALLDMVVGRHHSSQYELMQPFGYMVMHEYVNCVPYVVLLWLLVELFSILVDKVLCAVLWEDSKSIPFIADKS